MTRRKKKIRVLLVDDHPSVLEGIRAYLGVQKQIRVVGQALDGEEAIEKAKGLSPDIVVMDVTLPRLNGLEASKRIRRAIPHSKVIVYSMHEDERYVREARQAGAAAYVTKSSPLARLVHVIQRVQQGQVLFDSRISRTLPKAAQFEPTMPSSRFGDYNLTAREVEIVRLLADGLSIKEVSVRMGVAYYTALSHIKHIYTKLQVHTRGSAVAKAFREHLL